MNKTDLRNFSFDKLGTPEYSHFKLLLYWPIYGLMFFFVERVYHPAAYLVVHCALDDMIPFCEWFLIPYLFWFVYLTGAVVYVFLCDVANFRKMMWFIIISYSVTLLVYLVFPNCQHLRPTSFERDNILTQFIALFYTFDTDTNVCPSLHVIGSFAAMYALWYTPRFSSTGWRIVNVACCVLISISTVFMKQHSVIDVVASLPLCIVAYLIAYPKPRAKANLIRQI